MDHQHLQDHPLPSGWQQFLTNSKGNTAHTRHLMMEMAVGCITEKDVSRFNKDPDNHVNVRVLLPINNETSHTAENASEASGDNVTTKPTIMQPPMSITPLSMSQPSPATDTPQYPLILADESCFESRQYHYPRSPSNNVPPTPSPTPSAASLAGEGHSYLPGLSYLQPGQSKQACGSQLTHAQPSYPQPNSSAVDYLRSNIPQPRRDSSHYIEPQPAGSNFSHSLPTPSSSQRVLPPCQGYGYHSLQQYGDTSRARYDDLPTNFQGARYDDPPGFAHDYPGLSPYTEAPLTEAAAENTSTDELIKIATSFTTGANDPLPSTETPAKRKRIMQTGYTHTDPHLCYLCFRRLVGKSSVQRHLMEPHQMKRENVDMDKIKTVSEHKAEGKTDKDLEEIAWGCVNPDERYWGVKNEAGAIIRQRSRVGRGAALKNANKELEEWRARKEELERAAIPGHSVGMGQIAVQHAGEEYTPANGDLRAGALAVIAQATMEETESIEMEDKRKFAYGEKRYEAAGDGLSKEDLKLAANLRAEMEKMK